jgi:hypothetical protein
MQPAPGGGYRSLELNNAQLPVLRGYGAYWSANTPSPAITITGAYTPPNTVLVDCNLGADGFTARYFWQGDTQPIKYINDCNRTTGYGYADGIYRAINPGSLYFGWSATCSLKPSCSTSSSADAVVGVQGVRLTAEENSGPSLIANGGNNLWYQSGHYVRGGGWPVSFVAADPSGVCGTQAVVDGQQGAADVTSDPWVDTSRFTQCWPTDQATGTINTAGYSNGPLTLTLSASNAAGVVSSPTETLQVDNVPVSLALSTPNDPDPNVWVNHAVTVIANAAAGPSGMGGTSCSIDGNTQPYPGRGIGLNGTGTHTVSCGAWNNAYDVNGSPASSPTQAINVKIDETPPSVVFEGQARSNPTALTVDTGDGQSGVSGGQIEMRPSAGGSWSTLPTQFDGQHLLASFDDAGLNGAYIFEATSCDRAGNCASAEKTLGLPVRTASISSVSFEHVKDPPRKKVVRKRVLVGWHWVTIRRAGKTVHVKRGGHWKTIKVVELRERCTRERVKTGPHRSREQTVCHRPHLVLKTSETVPFGHSATVHGLLATATGVPIGGAPVALLTAPTDGLNQFAEQAAVTTDANGTWSANLPAGPSRIVRAVYDGSPTILPSSGQAGEIVPAQVRILAVSPRRVAWGDTVRIIGQLDGGYLPPGGALVRLRIGYGAARTTYGVKEHVTGDGRFSTTYTFGLGYPGIVRAYWFQIASLPMGDYPFAPAASGRWTVVVGGHPARPR